MKRKILLTTDGTWEAENKHGEVVPIKKQIHSGTASFAIRKLVSV